MVKIMVSLLWYLKLTPLTRTQNFVFELRAAKVLQVRAPDPARSNTFDDPKGAKCLYSRM